jgi:nucleotide-binding universal stress UspA family protein
MKILVPVAGPKPAEDKAEYVMNFAKMLGADVIALHIMKEDDQTRGERTLQIFEDAGIAEGVNVTSLLKKGGIVSSIAETAQEQNVDFVVMGPTPNKEAAEWVCTCLLEEMKIPVVVIPFEYKKLFS